MASQLTMDTHEKKQMITGRGVLRQKQEKKKKNQPKECILRPVEDKRCFFIV